MRIIMLHHHLISLLCPLMPQSVKIWLEFKMKNLLKSFLKYILVRYWKKLSLTEICSVEMSSVDDL